MKLRLDFSNLPQHKVREIAESLLANPNTVILVPEKILSRAPARVRGSVKKRVVYIRREEEEESARACAPTRMRTNITGSNKERTNKKGKGRVLTPKDELRYNLERFEENPTRKWAKKSLEVATFHQVWDGLSLTGKYLQQYAKRFYREWPGSRAGLVNLVQDTTLLYSRVGAEAPAAIEAVFSAKMKWAVNHAGLLTNQDSYARFVVPTIEKLRDERRRQGEQAEWKGARSSEASYEEVKL